ncbi:transposon-encoded TnpW family protein [Ruminococcaceae bacterium OttesenSCG-928-A16]|nr:transposon-encoded TnpW family protein [Ruminococcaceae bacterium OttesenSCG-928-A16]
MDKEHNANAPAEYQIGNTKYTVTPVYGDASQKEAIEDKIKRMILQDRTQKGAKP